MPDSAVNDYIAGAIGGAAGTVVGHPFDTLKIQIQTQSYGGKLSSLQECFKSVKTQSLSQGFFRGLSLPLLFHGSLDSIFFGLYAMVLRKTNSYDHGGSEGPPPYSAISVASAFATLPLIVLTCPIEVITITLQSQIPKKGSSTRSQRYFKGPVEAVRTIYKTSGLKGIYRGFWTYSAFYLPSSVVYMLSYAMFQYHGQLLFPHLSSQVINFVGGGLTGVFCCVITLPLDVIKSKLQADASALVYKGFKDCVKQVYVTEGFRAFFLGFWPLTLQAFPVNAVTLMVYSECVRHMNRF